MALNNRWHRHCVILYRSSSWQSRRAWMIIWPQPCRQTRSWGAQKRWREQVQPPHWTWTWWEKGRGWIPWDSSRCDRSSCSWISCCWFWLLRRKRRTRNLGFWFSWSRFFWRLCRLKSGGICRSWCGGLRSLEMFLCFVLIQGNDVPLNFFFFRFFLFYFNSEFIKN